MGDSNVKLTGRLLRHAVVRVGTDGGAWVTVEVGQSQGVVAAVAVRGYGAGYAAQHAAANAASHLRAGTLVRIHACGWSIGHRPHAALLLVGVDLIEQLEHFHPQEAAATRLQMA